jgi:LytS/YehU family sensor histidine kinase
VIAAREREGRLELEVSDSGAGGVTAVGAGTGVGLFNVRERLRLSFGAEGEMHVDQDPSGFRVLLSMPLVRRPASAEPPLTIAA